MAVSGVPCEPLSGLDFPANREKYRENIEFDLPIGLACSSRSLIFQSFPQRPSEIGAPLNRELSRTYQGICFACYGEEQ